MKITKNVVIELDEAEIRAAIRQYVESCTEYTVADKDVTLLPAGMNGGYLAKVEIP